MNFFAGLAGRPRGVAPTFFVTFAAVFLATVFFLAATFVAAFFLVTVFFFVVAMIVAPYSFKN
jgi:hypothetical protein